MEFLKISIQLFVTMNMDLDFMAWVSSEMEVMGKVYHMEKNLRIKED